SRRVPDLVGGRASPPTRWGIHRAFCDVCEPRRSALWAHGSTIRCGPIRDGSVIGETIDSRSHSGFVPDPKARRIANRPPPSKQRDDLAGLCGVGQRTSASPPAEGGWFQTPLISHGASTSAHAVDSTVSPHLTIRSSFDPAL